MNDDENARMQTGGGWVNKTASDLSNKYGTAVEKGSDYLPLFTHKIKFSSHWLEDKAGRD